MTSLPKSKNKKTCLLHLDDLQVGYEEPLFPPLNMKIESGQYWGLVGHNGSGKTTLLNTLISIIPKLGGEFTFLGGGMGYVPQRSAITGDYPMRVIDMVTNGADSSWSFLFPNFIKKEREAILSLMKETKVFELRDESFSALSEGQKQRVLITRAMACRPELLILDEPTSAMDAQAKAETLALLDTLREEKGLAILMVTHQLKTLKDRCSHLLVLDRVHHFSISGPIEDLRKDEMFVDLYGTVLGSHS